MSNRNRFNSFTNFAKIKKKTRKIVIDKIKYLLNII